jgi:hypothetical protein
MFLLLFSIGLLQRMPCDDDAKEDRIWLEVDIHTWYANEPQFV